VDETIKDQLRQQFPVLDPIALLGAIRDTQQELAAVSDGSGQPRAADDLNAFLDGLASKHQKQKKSRIVRLLRNWARLL
jgi:hypothetical protein